jgi:hypothetical protein
MSDHSLTPEERLASLKAALADKIGPEEAADIVRWYGVVKDVGCPNCGVDFRTLGDEGNLYPHFMGGCK